MIPGLIGTIYLLLFYFLENRNVPLHIIEVPLDHIIPFCEYFIIPYLMWFLFVAATVLYFALVNQDETEYKQLCLSLFVGMVIFLIISFIFPNGQNLRPVLSQDNIFKVLVNHLYKTDTSTNILPSLHVFHSVTCCIALIKNKVLQKNKILITFIYVLTISIVLSTLFLKQHSIIDVITALILNGVCYCCFYTSDFALYKQKRGITNMKRNRRGIGL